MNLAEIYQAIIDDPENKAFQEKGWRPVYTAHPKAKILIVGQAPGRLAQVSHIPWNDPSGENLRAWMDVDKDCFYDETKVAIIPMDFYFPGTSKQGDLPPRKGFAEKWHPLLLQNMPEIELILVIGQYAQKHYLGAQRKKNLTETVYNFQEYGPKLLPLVHPSPRNNIWHKKNPWFKSEVVPHLQRIIKKQVQ